MKQPEIEAGLVKLKMCCLCPIGRLDREWEITEILVIKIPVEKARQVFSVVNDFLET